MWHVLKILELNSGNHRGFGFLCLCILGLEKLSDVHGKSLIFLVTKEWQPWCILSLSFGLLYDYQDALHLWMKNAPWVASGFLQSLIM